jgi:ATPase family associated with various cellular activities (AAA)
MATESVPAARQIRVGVTGDQCLDIYQLEELDPEFPNQGGRTARLVTSRSIDAGIQFAATAFGAMSKAIGETTLPPIVPVAIKPSIETTMSKCLVQLCRYPSRGPRKSRDRNQWPLRVSRVSRIQDNAPWKHKALTFDPPQNDLSHLLIHDRNGAWRDCRDDTQGPATLVREFTARYLQAPPPSRAANIRIIVDLADRLPSICPDTVGRGGSSFESPVWRALAEAPDGVCVICSARMLRHEGILLGRHISWERQLEDLRNELGESAQLRRLGGFEHLIIRFGLNGAIYVHTPDVSTSMAGDGDGESQRKNRSYVAVFGPLTDGLLYRDRAEDGEIAGENIALAFALIAANATAAASDNSWVGSSPAAAVCAGLRMGLRGALEIFDKGYDPATVHNQNEGSETHIVVDAFAKAGSAMKDFITRETPPAKRQPSAARDAGQAAVNINGKAEPEDEQHMLGALAVSDEVLALGHLRRDGRREPFEILRETLNGDVGYPGDDLRPSSRINLALAIATFGTRHVFNRAFDQASMPPTLWEYLGRTDYRDFDSGGSGPADHIPLPEASFAQHPRTWRDTDVWIRHGAPAPVFVPLLRLGKIEVVDRHELESIRVIRNQMLAYLERVCGSGRETRKPLSIAVFGQPGSGKSFAVKEIIASVNESSRRRARELAMVECNVAQFRGVQDLESVWHQASSRNNEGKLPVVFFDEFDCAGNDGATLGWLKYFLGPMNDGVHHTSTGPIRFGPAVLVFAGGVFREFRELDDLTRGDRNGITSTEFESRKGPDFISRLHHHLNVASINGKHREVTPVIRRAILLRGIFAREALLVPDKENGVANIDEDVLYALLTVSEYKHEIRSVQNLVAMCRPINGRIEKASLPTDTQLGMHVNATDFLNRMHRSRWRREHGAIAKLPPPRAERGASGSEAVEPSASSTGPRAGGQNGPAALEGVPPAKPHVREEKSGSRSAEQT